MHRCGGTFCFRLLMHLVTLNVSDKLSEIDSVLSLQRDELETGGQTSTDLTQAW